MNIEDFEIKIKKYDRVKNHVIVNLITCKELEIRGFVVRYRETKYSSNPVWIVNPPSNPGRNKFFFHVVRLKNISLWESLQEKIIEAVKEYVEKETI